MTSFLTAVSGQFTKSVVLGFFLPAVLFLIVCTGVVLPTAGLSLTAFTAGVFPWEKESTLLAQTFAVVLLTVLLYNLNIPIIQLYEGYPWEKSWLGAWLKGRQQQRLAEAKSLRARSRGFRHQLPKDGDPILADALVEAQQYAAELQNSEYPERADLILPTRLGNVIRSAERYSAVQYGMDAVVFWRTLVAAIPSDYGEVVDSSKTPFDFMVNCSFLSAVAAALITAGGILQNHPFSWTAGWPWLRWALVFALLWQVFYRMAITRAAAWGSKIRGAFDLYRFDLLKKLGYTIVPTTHEEELALWAEINYRLYYPDDDSVTDVPYASQTTSLRVKPSWAIVRAYRKAVPEKDGKATVTITVKNEHPHRVTADSVVLVEKIAQGYKLLADTIKVTEKVKVAGTERTEERARTLDLTGLEPLEARLGELMPEAVVEFTYGMKAPTS